MQPLLDLLGNDADREISLDHLSARERQPEGDPGTDGRCPNRIGLLGSADFSFEATIPESDRRSANPKAAPFDVSPELDGPDRRHKLRRWTIQGRNRKSIVEPFPDVWEAGPKRSDA